MGLVFGEKTGGKRERQTGKEEKRTTLSEREQ